MVTSNSFQDFFGKCKKHTDSENRIYGQTIGRIFDKGDDWVCRPAVSITYCEPDLEIFFFRRVFIEVKSKLANNSQCYCKLEGGQGIPLHRIVDIHRTFYNLV